MNLKKVIILSLIINFVLAIASYFVFSFNVSLGLILGCIAGILAMTILVFRFKDIDLTDYKYLTKSMNGNLALRYSIYLIAFLIGVFIPSIFHVLGVFIGIIMVKVCVYIDAFTNKKM